MTVLVEKKFPRMKKMRRSLKGYTGAHDRPDAGGDLAD